MTDMHLAGLRAHIEKTATWIRGNKRNGLNYSFALCSVRKPSQKDLVCRSLTARLFGYGARLAAASRIGTRRRTESFDIVKKACRFPPRTSFRCGSETFTGFGSRTSGMR